MKKAEKKGKNQGGAITVIVITVIVLSFAGCKTGGDSRETFFETEWIAFQGRMNGRQWKSHPAVDHVARKILQAGYTPCKETPLSERFRYSVGWGQWGLVLWTFPEKKEILPFEIRFVAANGSEKNVFFNMYYYSLDKKTFFLHNLTGDDGEMFLVNVSESEK